MYSSYSKQMKPPFYQSYQSMASEPGAVSSDSWNVTSEMLNAWLIAPRIILELYAGKLNKQPQTVITDDVRMALTNYFSTSISVERLDLVPSTMYMVHWLPSIKPIIRTSRKVVMGGAMGGSGLSFYVSTCSMLYCA